MPKAKITKRAVEAIAKGSSDVVLWDTELKGFGCKITPKGKRAYFVYYRTEGGTQRRPFIGEHGAVTAEQAREIARQWLAKVATGADPSKNRQLLREAPTVADVCDRFLRDHVAARNKPKTVHDYERLIKLHINPVLGSHKIHEISRTNIVSFHHKLRETPYQANRALAVVSKIMNLSERWGYRSDGSNPCRHVEKYPEEKRERYLTREELLRLGSTLREIEEKSTETPYVLGAILLLMATGCRLSEILTLQWKDVDRDSKCLRLPDSKTGARLIHLNSMAEGVLARLEKEPQNPFVIIGRVKGEHLVNLEKPWRRIRKKARLNDLRLHDLRHTFASVGAGLGEGLPIIGKLLGHTQSQTTQRYAHLDADPVAKASERIGQILTAAMKSKP
jgi:integrase